MTGETEDPKGERRENLRLRAIFDEIRPMILRLLGAGAGWGGAPLELSAYRSVREAYPGLSALEVQQLVHAAMRVHAGSAEHRSAPAPEPLPLHQG